MVDGAPAAVIGLAGPNRSIDVQNHGQNGLALVILS